MLAEHYPLLLKNMYKVLSNYSNNMKLKNIKLKNNSSAFLTLTIDFLTSLCFLMNKIEIFKEFKSFLSAPRIFRVNFSDDVCVSY